MMQRKNRRATPARAIVAAVEAVEARQMFTTPVGFNGFYTQNFDGLNSQVGDYDIGAAGVTTNLEPINPSLAGWQAAKIGGTGAAIRITAGNGSSNAGGLYNFGSSSDRALGMLGSGSQWGRIGAVFTNQTGSALSQFTLTFTEEQWRRGDSTNEGMPFSYKIGATNISDASGFINNSAGDLTTLGVAGSTAVKTVTVTGINWQPGQTLAIRWQDGNSGGNDDGLAVDNLTLSAPVVVNAPGTLAVSPTSVNVNEDQGTVTFTVNRVGGAVGQVSADILLTPGTAKAGADYGVPSVTTVTFADGDTAAKTFTVPIIENDRFEVTENFFVGLSNPQGTQGAPEIGAGSEVKIADNDTAPYFKESFESAPGTTYTLEGPLTSTENFEYFGRYVAPDTSNSGRDDFTGGFDGNWAIQGQNHSGAGFGEGAEATRTVSVTNIDIQGREDLSTFLSLGALASEPAFTNWNITEGISIYASIDGGERVLIGQFKPAGIDGDLKLDSDLDGVGDGVTLTAGALQNFEFAIPGVGSSLTIDVDVTSTKSFANWALDNVRVDGTIVATSLPAWVAPGSAAAWDAGSKTLTVTGAATIIADPGVDAPVINASGAAAQVTIDPASDRIIHLSGVNLSNDADLIVSSVDERSHDNHVVVVLGSIGGAAPSFSVASASGSFLDLQDNDLIVHGGSLSAVQALAAAGRNVAPGGLLDGTWDGNGLRSSSANDAFNTVGYEQNTLAVVRNGDLPFGAFSDWAIGAQSETLNDDSIIIKYTYTGDFTLSGAVDDAASTIFSTFYDGGQSSGNGLVNGDTNFDGKVDDTDSTVFSTLFGSGTGASGLPLL